MGMAARTGTGTSMGILPEPGKPAFFQAAGPAGRHQCHHAGGYSGHPHHEMAILGATGCGKTSLVNLIPRFYDVTEGAVLVDGVDVREYNQKALREKVAVVLQKSELFSATIEENISWGNPQASAEAVKAAAVTAQADSFISSTAEKYDTIVAERGMSLSGGQKQRLSIARAILKPAEILILDDSTSALDLKTESDFYGALQEFSPQSTKIIIAQRIASVAVYFVHEKRMVLGMLAVVICGTLCGVSAPGLQSKAVDIIAGERTGNFSGTLALMLTVYLLYSASSLVQGLLSGRLSQRIVRRMREELFGKIADLPIRYLDTHSHGDVMSRMTNDIENISTTVSSALPSLFSGVLTIIGTVSVMVWYCWQLALLSFATVFLTFAATKILSGRVRSASLPCWRRTMKTRQAKR